MQGNFGLALAFLAMVWSSASVSAQQIRRMKLLTPQTGWVQVGQRLDWTTDGGAHWSDITPPTQAQESISSVFFWDASTGWVLLVRADKEDRAIFDLASTTDSGADWSVAHLTLPPGLDPTQLSGEAWMDFVDVMHGWVDLANDSSANFRLGALLSTTDGGRTWQRAPHEPNPSGPGIAGRIHFIDATTGWLAGGPADESLFVTRDGARSWREVSLKAPPSVEASAGPNYDTPVFDNNTNGFLPVTYSATEHSGSELALFVSSDRGLSWTASAVQPLEHGYGGVAAPSTLAGSGISVGDLGRGGEVTVAHLASAAKGESASARVAENESGIADISFVGERQGWLRFNSGRLLSTADGGATWADITPTRRGHPARQ
jgi:photosystem II stability/assembly factor-like uncharacterized protein